MPIGRKLEAFVLLVLQEFSIKEDAGPLEASFSIMGRITPSAMQSVSKAQLLLFERALRELRLGSLAKLKILHDEKSHQSESGTSSSATSEEQRVVDATRKLPSQAEEDEADQWPSLMLLGCATLDACSDRDLP